MRQITKEIQLTVDGSPLGFRLTKLDAFSGVSLMRLILRLQDEKAKETSASITILDLIASLSEAELCSVMNGEEWGYPELKHDTASCLRLVTEEIAWSMDSFFGAGGLTATPAGPNTSR